MQKSSIRIALSASAAVLALAISPAVHAAPPPAAPAAASDTSDASEIVVTAQKRSERLQDVAASVSVVSTADLVKQGAVGFADYARQVPGLTFTSTRAGNTQIVLRGISTGASQPGSTTGFYVDEAPVGSVNAYTGGNGITPDLDPSDLAQVEVLKGPQGTLYGAGAVGGLLKFSTAAPSLSHFEGSASAGINTVGGGGTGYSVRGMLNVPVVSDTLAVHGSAFYRHDAGYIDNVNPLFNKNNVNDAKIRGGRAVVAAKLAPNVSLNLSAILQDTTANGSNTIDVDAATLKPIYGDQKQSRFTQEKSETRLRLYNATLKADLGKVDLVSSTTYQLLYDYIVGDGSRSYGAALGGLGIRVPTFKHTARWSEEARASSNGLANGFLDLQAGFYWTHESDTNQIPGFETFSQATGAPVTFPQIAIASINSTYEEYSGFANARIHIGEKFDILGGLRYSHDKQTYLQDYQGLLVGPRTITPGGAKDDVTTWLVSPRYKISDDLMVYGRVATGYRPGGPNPAPPTTVAVVPLTFQPDKLTQYEVGFKAQTLDHALTVNAALFYTDWNNIQIQTSGGGFNYLVNGGAARSKGGELTLRYQPVHGLVFGANVNYTDAKLHGPAPAAGGLDGDRLPYIPHWAGALTADYSVPLGGSMKGTFGGTLNYTGSRSSDYSNKFPKHLPSYATFDLRAGLDFGRVTVSAFAKNLGDKRAILVTGQEGLAASNTPGAFYSAAIIQPRTIGAEAAIHF